MASEVDVRCYRPSDHAEVTALNLSALESAGADKHSAPEIDADLDRIEEVYLREGGAFLIAETSGRLIGMGALRPVGSHTGEIKRMRVAADYQRQGIGAMIYTQLEQIARDAGYHTLTLDTDPALTAARRFYEEQGFVDCGLGELMGIEVVFYRKALC